MVIQRSGVISVVLANLRKYMILCSQLTMQTAASILTTKMVKELQFRTGLKILVTLIDHVAWQPLMAIYSQIAITIVYL